MLSAIQKRKKEKKGYQKEGNKEKLRIEKRLLNKSK